MDESQPQPRIYQVITKLLNGKSQTLNFNTPTIPIPTLKSHLQTLTSIPTHLLLLLSNGKPVSDHDVIHLHNSIPNLSPPTVTLLLRLRGGKGGFGSLLRGAATKAGQKKTNNFDACRDMSGRRLRHVNAEKRMEEWVAEEKERRLEKVAEEFIKKKVKSVKKEGGDGAEKYVEKYRKDSERCREEVERSVRESIGAGGFLKRKVGVVGGEGGGGLSSKSKKLKIWMGKRKVDDSDSDDMDEEDSDDDMDEENEKSVVTNNGASSKEADGSLASVTGGKVEGESSSVGCSSESASEEEKETVTDCHLESIKDSEDKLTSSGVVDASVKHEESIVKNSNVTVPLETENFTEPESGNLEENKSEPQSVSNGQEAGATDVDATVSDSKVVIDKEEVSTKSEHVDFEKKPLNFDEFNSAAEMEVLGLERLKSELQERGLKCGGTLQERAARLYLLKTTPLEKIPKKLLAKK